MKLLLASLALLAPLTAAADPMPEAYVGASVAVGGSSLPHTNVTGTISLEAERHLGGGLWLHAAAGVSDVGQILENIDGRAIHGQLGVAGRVCTSSARLCAFAGIDAGARYVDVSGTKNKWVAGTGTDVMYTDIEPMLVPRFGLDLGGDTVRVRPSIEIPITPSGVAGMASLTFAVGL